MAKEKQLKMVQCHQAGSAVYGFGLLGALVYFFPHAPGFSDKALAIGKALVWPAILVYQLLVMVKA